MENNTQGATMPQQEAVKPLWEVLGGQTDTLPTQEAQPVTTPAATTEPEVKTEAPEVKPVEGEKQPEAAEKPAAETTPAEQPIELTAKDIKDAPKIYKEGSYQALAQDVLGFQVEKESVDDFKKAHDERYILREEAEKQAVSSKEQLFSSLDPKLATAFKMIDLGVPPELALNPTAQHDALLATESAELVRMQLQTNFKDWDEEMIDSEMEKLSADPNKLEIEARKIRSRVGLERQEILNTQSQIYNQQIESQKQQEAQKKVQTDTQFKEALSKEEAFIGLKLTPEAKSLIEKKYNSGAYDSLFNDAHNKLKAVLHYEFGDKFTQKSISEAKKEGKDEVFKTLANVPDTTKSGGGRVIDNTPNDTNKEKPLSNFPTSW